MFFIGGVFFLPHFQDKRISCIDALAHPYLDEGRLRYHTCMCNCCHNTSAGRQYTGEFEPVAPHRFDCLYEDDLHTVSQVKGMDSVIGKGTFEEFVREKR